MLFPIAESHIKNDNRLCRVKKILQIFYRKPRVLCTVMRVFFSDFTAVNSEKKKTSIDIHDQLV